MAQATSPLSEEQLKKLKVPELKTRCREAGVPVTGTKPTLIARLLAQAAQQTDATTVAAVITIAQNAPSTSSASSRASSRTSSSSASSSLFSASSSSTRQSSSSTLSDDAALSAPPPAKRVKTAAAQAATTTTTASLSDGTSQRRPASNSTRTIASAPLPRIAERSVPVPTNNARPSFPPAPAHPLAAAVPKTTQAQQIISQPVRGTFTLPRVVERPSLLPVISPSLHAGTPKPAPAPAQPKPSLPANKPTAQPVTAFKPLRPVFRPSSVTATLPEGLARSPKNPDAASAWLLPHLQTQSFRTYLPAAICVDAGSHSAALSFISTRACTMLNAGSLDTDLSALLRDLPQLLNVRTVVPGICAAELSDSTIPHFLATSGEVIGTAGDGSAPRADWNSYIEDNKGVDLLDRVKSPDLETFKQGISKHFLKRLSGLQDVGTASRLLEIAQNYVLAHVAVRRVAQERHAQAYLTALRHTQPHAISGSYQTMHDQQAEVAGMGAPPGMTTSLASMKWQPKVGLYLADPHQVESVSTMGLHPALAVVQTIAGAKFVLRQTGQVVGIEDEGVCERMQEVLGCDAAGRAIHRDEFK